MIGTEQERDAILQLVRKYGILREGVYQHYALGNCERGDEVAKDVVATEAAIRAMLAPDDAVVRKQIERAIESAYTPHMAEVDEQVINLGIAADAVIAVLRGEATR